MLKRLARLCVLAIALSSAISWLPAGIGNVGRKNTSLSGSFVRVTLPGGVSITHTIVAGQTALQVRDILVARINNETSFDAIAFTDPGDFNLAAFQVTTGGSEVSALQVDENDVNLDDIGLRFTSGRLQVAIRKISTAGNSVAANGSYRLKVENNIAPDYDQTFLTTSPAHDTASELDASIKSSLQSAGFTVTETATSFLISRPGDLLIAVQVDASDTGIIIHDAGMSGTLPQSTLPTLGDLALLTLMALLTAAGMISLGRRRASFHE